MNHLNAQLDSSVIVSRLKVGGGKFWFSDGFRDPGTSKFISISHRTEFERSYSAFEAWVAGYKEMNYSINRVGIRYLQGLKVSKTLRRGFNVGFFFEAGYLWRNQTKDFPEEKKAPNITVGFIPEYAIDLNSKLKFIFSADIPFIELEFSKEVINDPSLTEDQRTTKITNVNLGDSYYSIKLNLAYRI